MASEILDITFRYPHRAHVVRALSEDGLGVNTNANVDGSVTPVVFSYTPEPGYTEFLYRIVLSIQDSGQFDAGAYGNNITMTNGYWVWYADSIDGTHELIPESSGVKSNGDIGAYMFDVDYLSFGSGDNVLNGKYSFNDIGGPVILNGSTGDSFNIEFRDDLTGLNRHLFTLEGVRVPNQYL